jgi:hypothetical protein
VGSVSQPWRKNWRPNRYTVYGKVSPRMFRMFGCHFPPGANFSWNLLILQIVLQYHTFLTDSVLFAGQERDPEGKTDIARRVTLFLYDGLQTTNGYLPPTEYDC